MALYAVRRKLTTETPGTSVGYWNARKMPGLGALVGRQVQDVLALVEDLPRGHLVAGAARQHVGERRLPRSVRAHDGVDLALVDAEVETLEDLLTLDLDVEVLDL